jgi:2-oxoglutarate ferredoxin oxidoreductase subunit alpha
LENARQILNIECNAHGQMAGLIKEKTGIGIKHSLLKYDGRPFFPEEIIAKIKKML